MARVFNDTDPRNPSSMAEDLRNPSSIGTESVPPPEMLFDPSCYRQMCRMGTSCRVSNTLDLIETKLKDKIAWFHHHPQFKHVFHMPRYTSHKLMGLWALAIRTAYIKDNQWWSAVNGIPVRYSIREHALITGLCCDELPSQFKSQFAEKHSLSLSFAHRNFLDIDKVDLSDVKEKLMSMAQDNEDLVKMALLYFIGSIIVRRKNKRKGFLDPFFLKLVNHLDLCKTFPWGTLSFKYCLDILADKMKEPSERSKPSLNSWNLPCFITPLEIFPFECIANLKSKYRLPVQGAVNTCPRMCKMKFCKTGEKGFSLNGIYKSIGTDKDIESILVPTIDEHHLVAEVQEPETDDSTINNWKLVLMEQKKICWDHLYEKDQSNRVVEVKENTRERNGDNLETKLEVGEDEIIQREVELLMKKSDQQDKAIFDLRAQVEALKGQPRDDQQPQYSSPFQPDNAQQPQCSSPFQPDNEQQYSSFHQNEIEEQTRMIEEEERELQLHGEIQSQTQSSSFQPRDETQPLREPTETNEEEELHCELQLHGELQSQAQSSSFQPRDETQPLREPTETNEEEELHCELQLHQKPMRVYARDKKRKQWDGTRYQGISSRGRIIWRPEFFTPATYK